MDFSWTPAGSYTDIRYEKGDAGATGIAKITIARPEVRNAFRPETLIEISDALERAREDTSIGVIVLTGEGPDADNAPSLRLIVETRSSSARQ